MSKPERPEPVQVEGWETVEGFRKGVVEEFADQIEKINRGLRNQSRISKRKEAHLERLLQKAVNLLRWVVYGPEEVDSTGRQYPSVIQDFLEYDLRETRPEEETEEAPGLQRPTLSVLLPATYEKWPEWARLADEYIDYIESERADKNIPSQEDLHLIADLRSQVMDLNRDIDLLSQELDTVSSEKENLLIHPQEDVDELKEEIHLLREDLSVARDWIAGDCSIVGGAPVLLSSIDTVLERTSKYQKSKGDRKWNTRSTKL